MHKDEYFAGQTKQWKSLKNIPNRRRIEKELKENWKRIQEGMFIPIDLVIRQIDPTKCHYRRRCEYFTYVPSHYEEDDKGGLP